MILVSKFHDYYDSIARKHRDEKVVYVRETRQLDSKLDCNVLLRFRRISERFVREQWRGIGFPFEGQALNAVLFCGRVFPFLETTRRKSKSFWNYDTETVRDFREPYKGITPSRFSNCVHLPDYDGQGIATGEALALNRAYAPVVLLEQGCTTLNPCLEKLGFPLHAAEAAQCLLQFLAPRDPEIVEVGADIRIAAHGFDEMSFRRDKGGPTRKRKKIEHDASDQV